MAPVMIADRYELLEVLGRGAMGQVWRARDTRFDRMVAVKIVKPNATTPTDLHRAIRRFEREVRAIGTLSHRNIASAYDAGRDGERLYLVTELVVGRSVAAVLRGRVDDGSGPLPIPAALEIAEQICAGLHVAHAAGIVHRDLKPANLMLGDNGDVKIIDFGIVMLQEADASRLTLPGTTVGTLAYAAPEQLEGKAVDGRTDLYALGCVIYELIAGVRPFAADRAEVLLRQRMAGEVQWLHERRPETPTGVAHLVAELMQRNPSSRPATADAVRTRLRDLLASPRLHAHEGGGKGVQALVGTQPETPLPFIPDPRVTPAPPAAAPGYPAAASPAPVSAQPASGQPGYGTPVSAQPASGQPAYGTPVSAQPASGQPGYGTPVSAQPASGQPAYGTPVSAQPASGQPAPGSPVYGTPVSAQPASGQPGYPAPGSAQPGYGAPVSGQPAVGQPGYPAPGSAQPASAPPVYGSPVSQQPATLPPTPLPMDAGATIVAPPGGGVRGPAAPGPVPLSERDTMITPAGSGRPAAGYGPEAGFPKGPAYGDNAATQAVGVPSSPGPFTLVESGAAGAGPAASRGYDPARGRTYATGDMQKSRQRQIIVASIIAVVLVVGGVAGWIYVSGHRNTQTPPTPPAAALKVTGATLSLGGCSLASTTVTATIATNGIAGKIDYEWIRSDDTDHPTAGTVTVKDGQKTATAKFKWTTSLSSIAGGVVTLHVLRPNDLTKSNPVKFPCN